MKVRKVLAQALAAEMARSRDLRLQLVVREAALKHLESVRDERDRLLGDVHHLKQRITALTEVAS